jgi:alpha-1,2-mannosyltransferase
MAGRAAATAHRLPADLPPWAQPPIPLQANRNSARRPPISLTTAFLIFLAPHVLSAFLAPIQDCDEVFNYWEPTHFLAHGAGLQTWEYSPAHSIRSWAYAALHAAALLPARLLSAALGGSKAWEFYGLRLALALLCAACETRLFRAAAAALGPRVALYFMLAAASASGPFHAATALLPSGFAMCAAMLGAAAFVDPPAGQWRTARGVEWFAAGALLGWPFAAVLVAPYVALEGVLAVLGGGVVALAGRLLDGAVRAGGILVRQNRVAEGTEMLKGCAGSAVRNRLALLPKARLRPLEHRRLQRLQRRVQGAQHLRHRAVALLPA